ncbi:hypothetical protein FRC08_004070, partial [Ceratobasidium sp. 394]
MAPLFPLRDFIQLPPPTPPALSWPATIFSGFELVANEYHSYRSYLRLDNRNLGRLRTLYHSVETDLVPLWFTLEEGGLPEECVEEGLDLLAELFAGSSAAVEALQE